MNFRQDIPDLYLKDRRSVQVAHEVQELEGAEKSGTSAEGKCLERAIFIAISVIVQILLRLFVPDFWGECQSEAQ